MKIIDIIIKRKKRECEFAKNRFSVKNLKTGYVVQFRNGRYGLVLFDNSCIEGYPVIICDSNKRAYLLGYYDENMNNIMVSGHDIMKVFVPYMYPNISDLKDGCTDENCIWKRDD